MGPKGTRPPVATSSSPSAVFFYRTSTESVGGIRLGLRDQLRLATRPEHEALEACLSLDSPGLTLEKYARYLQGMRAMTAAVEPVLADGALAALGLDLAGRSKLAWLEQDLAHLGLAAPALGVSPPSLETAAQRLGCAYVLEGATLGATVLYERIASRWGLDPRSGAAFVHGYGPRTGPMWRRFVAALDAAPLTEAQARECVEAARATFKALQRVFEDQPALA